MPQTSKLSGASGRAVAVGMAKKTKPQAKTAGKASKQKPAVAAANIQWHPGFYGAAELEYRSNAAQLSYEQEHEFGSKPQRLDLLIIKKDKGVEIENETGKIFRSINIIEYKGPDDILTLTDYYKGIGYGCQYKGFEEHVNDYPAEEMTISFFVGNRPVRLFAELKNNGFGIEEKYPGVYYIHDGHLFDYQQIVVLQELDRKRNHHAFLILNKKVSQEDYGLFFERTKDFKTRKDRHNLSAVLRVSSAANEDSFEIYREGIISMKDVFHEVMLEEYKDELEAERKAMQKAMQKAAQKAAQEAAQKAAQKAAKETAEKTAEKAAKKLHATGMSSSTIASVLEYPISTVRKWVGAT